MEVGYHLSSEEHSPLALVENAAHAESNGFQFLSISDHFHPWIDKQGESAFVWGVIGGIARATREVPLFTAVTCPIIRLHPAIVAQAAATSACLMPGRFMLGVGTGENLNEHIFGSRWPPAQVRLEMLEEAIEVMRMLWSGEDTSHHGRHYTVENARIYSMPEEPPDILIAAKGPKATALAAEKGDGLIGTAPDADQIVEFEKGGGAGKPRFGMFHVCWAADKSSALRTAHEWWPNAGMKGEMGVELPLPRHFEQAAKMVSEQDVAGHVLCGPDPEPIIKMIHQYEDAGYDHVFVHQVGPDQKGFLEFCKGEVLTALGR